jgi:hypothetical protein
LANEPFFKGRFSKPYQLDPPTLLTPRLVVNLEKSDLIQTQAAIYLGIKFDSLVGLAYPSDKRIENWVSIVKGFVVERSQTALS